MTRRHVKFLLSALVLLLVGLFYWRSTQTKRVEHKQENKTYSVDSIVPVLYKDSSLVEYEGILKPVGIKNVSFSFPGTLLIGDFALEVGKTFRENDILYKLDIYALYKDISAKKKALKATADRLNQEIAANHADQKDVWDTFTSNLLPTKRLPGLPTFITKSKNPLFQEFIKTYEVVERLEAQIEDYYVFAPFSGTIVSVKKKIGEQIRAGECVAQIAPFQIYFVEFKIPKEDALVLKRKDEVSMIQGHKQFKGRVSKITQKADGSFSTVECSISSKVSTIGQKVKLQLQRNSAYFFVPYHLVRSNALWIYRSGRSMKIEATIIEWKKDAVGIKELKPGDLVLRKSPKSRTISCK